MCFKICLHLSHEILTFSRLMKLLDEIMQEKENKTIVFTETKRRADELTRRMRREG